MIEINGNFYDWSEKALTRVSKRLLKGDELTLDYKHKIATINKYTGSDIEATSWDYAEMIIGIGILECDSGNLETGERHYKVIEH